MSRPGDRLRRLAARICSERACRRLIDPAVADLQADVAEARRSASWWRTLRARGAGYLSVAKVLTIAIGGDLRDQASTWQPEERVGARRGVLVATGATAVVTASLILLAVSSTTAPEEDWALLSLYLTPSTLPITAPLGLVLGVAWAFHGAARTRKLAVAASIGAVLCSLAMFLNLGWVTPDANQAYRETRFAFVSQDTTRPARGFNELSWSGKRARLAEARAIESPHEVRYLEAAFHQHIAMTVAPVPLVGLMLALAFRCRWGRGRMIAAAVAVGVAHPLLVMSSSFYGARLTAPPIAIGWAATALCAAAAVLVTLMPPRRRA